MAVNYRIKEVMKRTGFTLTKYAEERQVTTITVSRKVNHGKWTLDQLFELAEITGCKFQCCFVFKDGERIYLHDENEKGEAIMPTDYVDLLCEKVRAEYNAYIVELKQMTPEQIIDRAYEKVIKEDMVTEVQNGNFDQVQAKALCREKYPLDRMYQEWLDTDVSHMQMLKDSIDDTATKAVKEMKENKEKVGEADVIYCIGNHY